MKALPTGHRLARHVEKIPESLLLLGARIFTAAVFWQSGRTKMDGWQLSESAAYLFEEEYRLPLVDPLMAAHAAAAAEHIFPILLVVGFATRLPAFALLVMTAVIQFFVYPDAWATHGTWAMLLLLLVMRGPGAVSPDRLVFPPSKTLAYPGDVP